MEIKHGMISCDSHAQLDRDAFTSHMSKTKWGELIPQVVEVDRDGQKIERWAVHGKPQMGGITDGVVNCPGAMPDHRYRPQRWEEVPRKVYDPGERLNALDEDGVDAEVLFPNGPAQLSSFHPYGEEYELACVQAYNDALGEWKQVSDRYVPLALIPYLSPMEAIVKEVRRAAKHGHGGITLLGEPSSAIKGLKHTNDPYWDPLWAVCEELDLPVHWHAGAAMTRISPSGNWDGSWRGYTRSQSHSAYTAGLSGLHAQAIPNLLLSGRLDRFPRLKWVQAETGMGWFAYVLEACDFEWEQRHLWTEGILTRPSETFRRQILVDFWFERGGVELRHTIGIENIMWESDYPHVTSTYPESRQYAARTLAGVPEDEQRVMLYENAARLYKLC